MAVLELFRKERFTIAYASSDEVGPDWTPRHLACCLTRGPEPAC
jgi:hypothetical protein